MVKEDRSESDEDVETEQRHGRALTDDEKLLEDIKE